MSADWQVGDLALCVEDGSILIGGARSDANGLLVAGRTYRVVAVHLYDGPLCEYAGCHCLKLAEFPHRHNGFLSDRFRKIRPDEPTGELRDWELLLDQYERPKVKA